MPNNHRKFVKVRKEGGSRVLALTPFIPPDWKMVKITKGDSILEGEKPFVILLVERVV